MKMTLGLRFRWVHLTTDPGIFQVFLINASSFGTKDLTEKIKTVQYSSASKQINIEIILILTKIIKNTNIYDHK